MVWHHQCRSTFKKSSCSWLTRINSEGKHAGTRCEDKWRTSQNARHQWRVPIPRLLGHRKWWLERHKTGSPWKGEGGRDLIKSHPRRQNFLPNSTHRKESAPSGSRQPSSNRHRVSSRVCQKSGYKRMKRMTVMARSMVKCKLSPDLLNCRGWPWVPPAVRSTHAGLAAARWPMHAAWGCRKKIC